MGRHGERCIGKWPRLVSPGRNPSVSKRACGGRLAILPAVLVVKARGQPELFPRHTHTAEQLRAVPRFPTFLCVLRCSCGSFSVRTGFSALVGGCSLHYSHRCGIGCRFVKGDWMEMGSTFLPLEPRRECELFHERDWAVCSGSGTARQ